jgi:hypothetical protein
VTGIKESTAKGEDQSLQRLDRLLDPRRLHCAAGAQVDLQPSGERVRKIVNGFLLPSCSQHQIARLHQ